MYSKSKKPKKVRKGKKLKRKRSKKKDTAKEGASNGPQGSNRRINLNRLPVVTSNKSGRTVSNSIIQSKRFSFASLRKLIKIKNSTYSNSIEQKFPYYEDKHRTKAEAEKDAKKHNCMAMGLEKLSGGARTHISCNLNGYYAKLNKLDKLGYMFHEVIFDKRPTKFILDIECDKDEKNKDLSNYFNKMVENIIQRFIEFLKFLGKKIKAMKLEPKRSWFLVMDASRDTKFSVHVIMHKGYGFEDANTCRNFIMIFKLWCLQKEVKILKEMVELNGDHFIKYQNVRLFGPITEEEKKENANNWTPLNTCFVRNPTYVEVSERTHINVDNPFDTSSVVKKPMILYSYYSPIDIGPLKNTNGTLRCYYSTKASHRNDERYRLKLIKDGKTSDLGKDCPNFKQNVKKCLVQCGLSKLAIGFKDWDRDHLSEVFLQKEYEKMLGHYTYLMYRLFNVPRSFLVYDKEEEIMKMDYTYLSIHLSHRHMKRKYNTEKNIYKYICAGLGIVETSSKSNEYGYNENPEDFKCSTILEKRRYSDLYDIVEKVLYSYTNNINRTNLYSKYIEEPVLNKIKTNKQRNYLVLDVKNVRCEIIYKSEGRKHSNTMNKSTTSGVYLKISLDQGFIYQKCFRQKCAEKCGSKHTVKEEFITKIKKILGYENEDE